MPSLRRLVGRLLGKAPKQSAMHGTTEMVQGLAKQLTRTSEEECTCDEAFELLDQFAEASARGADAAALLPLIYQHLELCPDCKEEFEALLQAMKSAPQQT